MKNNITDAIYLTLIILTLITLIAVFFLSIVSILTAKADCIEPAAMPTIIIPESTNHEIVEPPTPDHTHVTIDILNQNPPVVKTINQEDLEMLACVIYQEAGSDACCDDCRRYVGDIVLNRVDHPSFPDTIEEVLTAPGQYGEYYWTGVVWPERAQYDCETEAVKRAYRIAYELLSGSHSHLYGDGYIWQAGFTQGSDGFWCCGVFYGK